MTKFIYDSFVRVLGDYPIANFPGIIFRTATDTARLPPEYIVLNVSLSPLNDGVALNRTVRANLTFSLHTSGELRSRAQNEDAFLELCLKVLSLTPAELSANSALPRFYGIRISSVDEVSTDGFDLVQSFTAVADVQL